MVRKTGPRITRELAAQEANAELGKFDFVGIVDALRTKGLRFHQIFVFHRRRSAPGSRKYVN